MPLLLDQTPGLLAFVRTIQTGSFSEAARSLGSTPSAISRSVSRLERRLGARLLQRSTRMLTPTREGAAYYERIEPLLRALDEASDAIRSPGALTGLLRISAPSDLGRMLLDPVTKDFMPRHPGLQLEFSLADRRVDLIREGYDVALRVGALADSELSSRLLANLPMVLVASRAYVAQHGEPGSVEALGDHVHARYVQGGRLYPITFEDGRSLNPEGAFDTDWGEALRIAAINGVGIIQVLRSTVKDDIERGDLLPILPQHPLPRLPVHALHAFGRHAPGRVRALIDFLAAQFASLA